MGSYTQGIFKPRNPEKYKGNAHNIVYRSSWELAVLGYLDRHPGVLQYSSEEVVVPYISPLDNRRHRYFVDFWVKLKGPEDQVREVLLEVKPKYQTVEPKKPSGKTTSKTYIRQVSTYLVNQAKWEAATKYAAGMGMSFQILTEDDIPVFKR